MRFPCVPSMFDGLRGGSPRSSLMEVKESEAQGRRREAGSEGSVERTRDAPQLGSDAEATHPGAVVVSGGVPELQSPMQDLGTHPVAIIPNGDDFGLLRVLPDNPLLSEQLEADGVGVGRDADVEDFADRAAVVVAGRPQGQQGLVGQDEIDGFLRRCRTLRLGLRPSWLCSSGATYGGSASITW